MDNNLPEVEIHEKKNYTVVLIIILLFILALGGWYALNKQKDSIEVSTDVVEQNNNVTADDKKFNNDSSISKVEGVLVSVDTVNSEIKVSLSTGDKKEGVIKVVPEIVIQKLIVSKKTGESNGIEINLSELQAGDNISISYSNSDNGNPFDNALVISSVIETDNFEETYQEQANKFVLETSDFVYVKGQITSIDKNMIEYVAYTFTELGTEKHLTLTQESTKFYAIQNAGRMNIEHAKTPLDKASIKVGDDILVAVDKNINPLQENAFAMEIIVINK